MKVGRMKAEVGSMLALVVLAATFLAVESNDCVSGTTLTGACESSFVDVESKSGEITATLEVKKGGDKFDGSITIGNCVIKGRFNADEQTFKRNNKQPTYDMPIKIVAKEKEVTLLGDGRSTPKKVCNSPFTLTDGKAKTTIKMESKVKNVLSLRMDGSVEVAKVNEEKKWPSWIWPTIISAIVGLIIVAIIVVVVTWLCCCWKKKNKKKKEMEVNANVEKDEKKKSIKQPVGLPKSRAERREEAKVEKQKEKQNQKPNLVVRAYRTFRLCFKT
ncbi:hypothetical protein M3Y96_00576500 [Aphelenchoides besseyi]|nr:hypothetical protein M3Y96_00576500 [Aphelenchoides besseyi]